MPKPPPIDPETGEPVRNWPTGAELRRERRKANLIQAPADDKDPAGNWTLDAIVRYDNQYNDRSEMT
jgi:hypothetical protein